MADINCEGFVENSIYSNANGQLTPQEKALENLLIRDKIVRLLDFFTLQSCRLVSQSWCKWASCGILEKDCCQVRLTPATIGDRLGMLTSSSKPGQGQGQPRSCCFPCSDFVLLSSCSSKWKDADIDLLISVLGHQIKSLTFGQGRGSVVTSDLIQRVFLPLLYGTKETLKKLVLKDHFICFNCDFMNGDGNDDQLVLPSASGDLTFDLPALHHLCLSSPESSLPFQMNRRQSLSCKIMDMAPNLKRVENLWVRNTDPDFWTRNIKLIKSLEFQDLLVPLEDPEMFTSTQPQLEILSVARNKSISELDQNENPEDAHEQLYKILESSKNTLRTLRINLDTEEMTHLRWLSPFSRIPPLPRLKNLQLKLNCDVNLNFYFDEIHLRNFPGPPLSDTDLQELLPSLKNVTLVLNMYHYWGHFRPFSFSPANHNHHHRQDVCFSNNLKSVQTLQLCGAPVEKEGKRTSRNINWNIHFPSGFLQRVQDLFPNIRTVLIRDTAELDEMLPEFLRLFSHLQNVQFDLSPDRSARVKGDSLCDYLNSILSGVPVLQWKIMREARRDRQEKMRMELISRAADSDADEREMDGQAIVEEMSPISFCYLSRLKSIKIEMLIGDGQWIKCLENCPISSVVLRHLFFLNPQLKISIHFNRKAPNAQKLSNLLEPLVPFVEICHQKEENPFLNS